MSRRQIGASAAVAMRDRGRAVEVNEPLVMVVTTDRDLFNSIVKEFPRDLAYHLCSASSRARSEFRRFEPDVVIVDIRTSTSTAHPLALVPSFARAGAKVILLGATVSRDVHKIAVASGAYDIVDQVTTALWVDDLRQAVGVGLRHGPSVAPDSDFAIVGSTVH